MTSAKIPVGRVPREVEHYLDYPPAGKHLAIVLDAWSRKCHVHTLKAVPKRSWRGCFALEGGSGAGQLVAYR